MSKKARARVGKGQPSAAEEKSGTKKKAERGFPDRGSQRPKKEGVEKSWGVGEKGPEGVHCGTG